MNTAEAIRALEILNVLKSVPGFIEWWGTINLENRERLIAEMQAKLKALPLPLP